MDATDQEQEQRRERLRAWISANGGHSAVVTKWKLKQGQASFLSQVVNGYSFGSRAARGMESRLGMPARYLEGLPPAAVAVPQPAFGAGCALEVALRVVLDALAAAPQRDKLRTALMAVLDDDAPAYRQRLAELLAAPAPTPDLGLPDRKSA